ncbi:MAG: hypothetical protein V4638_09175 [Bacteroidota bacterium]
MQFLKIYRAQIIIFAVLLAYFSMFFGEVILSPNSFLLGSTGDGIKNYYTFAYQVRHEGASLHFSGMNYPFGEHVLYTDGMPLLAFVVGLFPFLQGYEVGIFHYFLFLSVIAGAFICLKLLRFLKVNDLLAIAGSLSIVIMSPQMYRINGHFSLSLLWVLPLVFLLLLKWHANENKGKYAWYLALTVFLVFFTHPYLGLMAFMTIAASFLCFLMWRKITFRTFFSHLGIVSSSMLVFMTILKLTDHHVGRTAVPNGFFEHFGYLETTFVPVFSPLKPLLRFFFPILHDQPWEAWAYIGCLTLVFLLSGFITIWVQKIRKKKSVLSQENDPLPPLFFAGVLMLLFSYQIPLSWFSQEFVHSLKVFNQFRALGRFAWVFFYIAQIYAIVLLHRAILNRKVLIIFFTLFIPVLAVVESYQMHNWIFAKWKIGPNLLREEGLTSNKEAQQLIAIMKKEKDALILPLPYFHIGSERINLDVNDEMKKWSFITSYHTGFPLIASLMSRTSVDEARKLLNLFNSDHNQYSEKELMDRKIWLLVLNEPLFFNQEALLQSAELKFKGERTSLYLFNYGKFVERKKEDMVKRKKLVQGSKVFNQDFQLSDSSFFLSNDYENDKSEHVFAGKGAKVVPRAAYSILAEIHSKGAQTLNASFWYYIGKDENYSGLIIVEEQDTITKEGSWVAKKDLNQFTVFHKDWELVEMQIPVKEGPYFYRFFLLGSFDNDKTFTFDNLVIREQEIDVQTSDPNWCPDGKPLFNNVPQE